MTYRLRNLLIALGLAAAAAILVSVYVTQYKHDVQSGEGNVYVYVAASDIPAGTPGSDLVGDSKMIKKVTVAERSKVPGAVQDEKDLASTYVKEPIYTGEQISLQRLGSAGSEGLRGQLKGPMRAIELTAEPQRLLAGTLQSGDHVDVVATWEAPSNSQHFVSRVLVRNLLVLKAPETGSVRSAISGPNSNASVQLRLTDLQAHKLFFVAENGEWSLVLRPPSRATDSVDNLRDAISLAVEGLREAAYRPAMGGAK
jgi:Flp pilus assembly protein CpaB